MRHLQLCLFTCRSSLAFLYFFFFHDTPTTEIYTLSLHDALPISTDQTLQDLKPRRKGIYLLPNLLTRSESTRLNSSHVSISYAVFCLKKKKKQTTQDTTRSTIAITIHPSPRDELTCAFTPI